ncbi:MAG: transglutaminase domain-containing protein [Alistipes sp.]|jgi:hypothetical protein|nr:transglutaminase domain-containing protein [Alistipes sp.]
MKNLLLSAALVALAASTVLTATSCDTERREAMDYLEAYMPAGDRDTLPAELVANNVDYALRARREFSWAVALPDSIFLNEVLPYAVVDEPREDWRPGFYDIFAPKVRDAKDIREAIDLVNRDLNKTVGVEYNTLRRATNQNASQSMEQGMASCTGLSIILVEALRSVGIPARFAGTAAWHDDRGNHSWVEVWIDGKWYFTEFYPDPLGLDHSWFLADAGQGTASDPEHAIWAVSYKPVASNSASASASGIASASGEAFPMVWSPESTDVHGVNVTERYTERMNEVMGANLAAGTHVPVRFTMWLDADRATNSGDRVAANVDVFRGAVQMGGGRTSGPHDDMNKTLSFLLEKNTEYTFMYADAAGEIVRMTAQVGDEPTDVAGYMQ